MTPPSPSRSWPRRTRHRAKALGRQARDFEQQTWNKHRFDIVVAASTAKFGQHSDLRGFLLATRERDW